MHLKEWLDKNRDIFTIRDLNFLIKVLLNLPAYQIYDNDFCLSEDKIKELERVKSLYKKGIPLAYILGVEEFYGNLLKVNKHTLIPRPCTEFLVEKSIEIIKRYKLNVILDLCCGCGNIAISILNELKEGLFFASDISFKTIKVAKENISKYRLNIHLVVSDLLTSFKQNSFDLIVSNPPYVEDDYLENNKELDVEPKIALSGGEDGLYFIKKIIAYGFNYLKDKGFLLMELGAGQKEKIRNIKELNFYRKVSFLKDYNNLDRVLLLRK